MHLDWDRTWAHSKRPLSVLSVCFMLCQGTLPSCSIKEAMKTTLQNHPAVGAGPITAPVVQERQNAQQLTWRACSPSASP